MPLRPSAHEAINDLRLVNLRKLIDERYEGVAGRMAKRIGMEPTYMSRLFNRKKTHGRNIGDDWARKIEDIHDLDDGWMDTTHDDAGNIHTAAGVVFSPEDKVSPAVAAGELQGNRAIVPLIQEGDPVGVRSVIVTERWMYQHLGMANVNDVALVTASGDAMGQTFHDGDVLFVDRSHDSVKTDAIYALTLNGELFVRRVQRQPDGDLKLIADNAVYAPQVVSKRERASMVVLGRVIGAWRWQRL